jgi:glucan phosphoethanolaminetransferase (alkaline phosphatase superfamily)
LGISSFIKGRDILKEKENDSLMNQEGKLSDINQEIKDLKVMNSRDEMNQFSSWIIVFTGFGFIVFIIWSLIVFPYDLEQTNGLILFIIQMIVFVFSILNIINWFAFGRKNLKIRIETRNNQIKLLEKEINEQSND